MVDKRRVEGWDRWPISCCWRLWGLIAQLVDGSLGMAYGVTSQSLLLTIGIAPGSCVGERAHCRGRHDGGIRRLPLAVQERGLGESMAPRDTWCDRAFFGAVVLVRSSPQGCQEPIVAIFLFGLGVFDMLARFSFRRPRRPVQVRPVSRVSWLLLA